MRNDPSLKDKSWKLRGESSKLKDGRWKLRGWERNKLFEGGP
jgi:hypothetical protein